MKLLPHLSGMAIRVVTVSVVWCALVGLTLASLPATAANSTILATPAAAGACDPSHASCVPATCTPLQQALGTCSGSGAPGLPPGTVAPMCMPGGGGDPGCGGGAGPAAVGGGAGGEVQMGGGNPINLVTGDKYQLETDVAPLPGVLGLELRRHYNSLSSHAGLIGAGWHMSYETVLYDMGSQLEIVQADGQRLTFHRGVGSQAALCASTRPQDGQVSIVNDAHGNTSYLWRWPDGRKLLFSGGSGGGHPLQGITAAGGEQLVISYSPKGDLLQVRDPQGRRLDFIYDARRVLHAIDTPLGRFDYAIDAHGRLTAVQSRPSADAPPTRVRVYHYEDRYNGGHANALTGISLRTRSSDGKSWIEQRLSTYAYAADGRAILTTKGEPRRFENGQAVPGTGIEQLDVAFVDKPLPGESRPDAAGEVQVRHPGKTVFTNSLGQKNELLSGIIGGHYRQLQTTGPGCTTCGASNMRYAYNANAQVVRAIKLDDSGRPLTARVFDYDRFGRLHREGIQARAAERAPVTRWIRRYEYEDTRYADGSVAMSTQPSLMAEPSVAAGKEHVLRFAYNALGQRTRLSEEGWAPGEQAEATPTLTRSVSYEYALIHGHSVLARIDGPLHDGPRGTPIDSDITEFHYDEAGERLLSITSPGGGVMRIEREDALGNATRVVLEDAGRSVRRDLAYDAEGRLVGLDETAWMRDASGAIVQASELHRSTRYERDAMGRLTIIHRPDGTVLKTSFDIAGEPIRLTAPDGSFVEVERDTETRVVGATRHAADSSVMQTLRMQRSAEHFDRVEGLADDLGELAHFGYAAHAREDGRPVEVLHASGARTLYEYDEREYLLAQTLASGSADALQRRFFFDAAGRTSRIEDRSPSTGALLHAQAAAYDDFGRKVGYASPEHGPIRYVWDSADRLVASVGMDRHVHRFSYDTAGRLAATGLDDRPTLSTYAYAGALLVEARDTSDGDARHAKELKRLQRDAFGRVLREEHWLADVRGAVPAAGVATHGKTTVTAFTYDPASGHVLTKSIVDPQQREHRFDYRWDVASGRLTGIAFNGQPVVSDIQGSWLGGTTAIAWADGTREDSTRDARGRLTDRVVHRPDSTPELSQHWAYDAGGRLRLEDADGAREDYAYDLRNRVVAEHGAVADARFEFDPENNRMREVTTEATRRYMFRADRLVAVEPSQSKPGWFAFYDARGATIAKQLTDQAAATHPARLDTSSRPLLRTGFETNAPVSYEWGLEGERLSKTVAGQRTWYHYDDADEGNARARRLSAEAADDGAITSHYLYADGRMVARIDTPETLTGVAGAWWNVRRVVLGWFGRHPSADGRAYAVHTDQRGAVVALSDGRDGLVWHARYDAWGEARLSVARVTMNVRLAGQYYDPETGTNDNLNREYDPSTGRYLTPDPIASNAWLDLDATNRMSGVNPYAYVSADPLGHVDTQGLYESDVHFYMTFFLAICAGMSSDDARMMAEATQFVDDDPTTKPVDETNTWTEIVSAFHNAPQLKDYHFTLSGPDGKTLDLYATNTITTTDSPQLAALHSYALPGPNTCGIPNDRSLQFMGEYLHAYEDTFAHRDSDNKPYDATIHLPLGMGELGLGHATGGHNPDETFNHTDILGRTWNNEARTATMESAVYSRIVDYMTTMNYKRFDSHRGTVTDWNDPILQKALADFNAYHASNEEGDMAAKIAILNKALGDLKYTDVNETWSADASGNALEGSYSADEGYTNRKANYDGLKDSDYPNAILKTEPPAHP